MVVPGYPDFTSLYDSSDNEIPPAPKPRHGFINQRVVDPANLQLVNQRLLEPPKRKSRLETYFDGHLEFMGTYQPLSPSPPSTRSLSPEPQPQPVAAVVNQKSTKRRRVDHGPDEANEHGYSERLEAQSHSRLTPNSQVPSPVFATEEVYPDFTELNALVAKERTGSTPPRPRAWFNDRCVDTFNLQLVNQRIQEPPKTRSSLAAYFAGHHEFMGTYVPLSPSPPTSRSLSPQPELERSSPVVQQKSTKRKHINDELDGSKQSKRLKTQPGPTVEPATGQSNHRSAAFQQKATKRKRDDDEPEPTAEPTLEPAASQSNHRPAIAEANQTETRRVISHPSRTLPSPETSSASSQPSPPRAPSRTHPKKPSRTVGSRELKSIDPGNLVAGSVVGGRSLRLRRRPQPSEEKINQTKKGRKTRKTRKRSKWI